jgi:hypothetical protein
MKSSFDTWVVVGKALMLVSGLAAGEDRATNADALCFAIIDDNNKSKVFFIVIFGRLQLLLLAKLLGGRV